MDVSTAALNAKEVNMYASLLIFESDTLNPRDAVIRLLVDRAGVPTARYLSHFVDDAICKLVRTPR